EGAEEQFDLGGPFKIGLVFNRAGGAKHTILAAVGSVQVTPETEQTLCQLDADPTQIKADKLAVFTDESNELREALRETLNRAIRLARWRIGASGRHDPRRATTGSEREWSLDGTTWRAYPMGVGAIGLHVGEVILKWLPDVKQSYADLLRSGVDEP